MHTRKTHNNYNIIADDTLYSTTTQKMSEFDEMNLFFAFRSTGAYT